jgi:hypothetical protein
LEASVGNIARLHLKKEQKKRNGMKQKEKGRREEREKY